MHPNKIKLSLVTINLNNLIGLTNTIHSVIPQLNNSIEYLIIDGLSNDGSIELIKQHQHNLSYWSAEKDMGIYHAMNKGITKANGEYILFLNSGDVLIEDISKILPLLKDKPDILSCAIHVETDSGSPILRHPIPNYTPSAIFLNCLPHQSTLIKRSLFEQYGCYDESFHIAADLEFWLRIVSNPIKYKASSFILSKMEKEGVGASRNEAHYQERFRIFKKYSKGIKLNLDTIRLVYRNRGLIYWYLIQKMRNNY